MLTTPHERVRLEARRHEVVLVGAFLRALALTVGGGACLALGWPWSIAGPALVGLGAFLALLAVWRWERTRVVLTTDKLFVVHGTLRRRAAAVRLNRVDTIEVEQTLVGRVLGYGTVVAGDLEIPYVPEPRRIYTLVAR